MEHENDQLTSLYEGILLNESQATNTTGNLKSGQGFEGEEKAQASAIKGGDPIDAEGIRQKKPVDGPSQKTDEGKPKPLGKKEANAPRQESISLSFDDLYKQTIQEEEDFEIAPASDIESDDFNQEEGDFTDETDIDEEIDLASELRLLADRMAEIADKLSVDEEETDPDDLEGGGIGDESEDDNDFLGQESVQHRKGKKGKNIREAITSEPEPKPLKKTSLGPKMSQKPSNKIGKSGAKKAALPSQKTRNGQLETLPKTSFGPNMSQNPSGTGPAVKGQGSDLVA